jgi:hypothetical protein
VTALLAVAGSAVSSSTRTQVESSLIFDANAFAVKSATVDGQTFQYRAYEGIVYVARPVDVAVQRMSVFVRVEYFEGKSIGGYDANTAPIFLPNSVGGYMPGPPGGPGTGRDGGPNAALVALSKGYVVAAPGVRGRTNQDASGSYVGKAPAVIVDLKAAVRYLRFNDARMPGTAERIVSNGTSAGGAISALLGASGNNSDFEPYLQALGAAKARDDVHATSAYCPITNLEHADMAYEWQFSGVNEYTRMMPRAARAGRPQGQAPQGPPPGPMPGGQPPGGAVRSTMTEEQVRLSGLLKAQFPEYVNGLGLKAPDGTLLRLDTLGSGSFKDHVKSFVIASAQKALGSGKDPSTLPWVTIEKGRVADVDFEAYVRFATRMKVTPAFDALDLSSPENDLFGSERVKARHFTRFGHDHTTVPAALAEPQVVKMMNAMSYIGAPGTTTARFWRIRHGSVDRDTSLAIPVILATRLVDAGRTVDFAVPWGVGHGGDYDLAELFEWVGRVCR